MSQSKNAVCLRGHLGADPELRYTPNGRAVATMRIATNEVWTGSDGKKHQNTEWHRVTVWGKDAENCTKFLTKGRLIEVEGKLQTRQWEDKQGAKRSTTEVVARKVWFLGSPSRQGEAAAVGNVAPDTSIDGFEPPVDEAVPTPDDSQSVHSAL